MGSKVSSNSMKEKQLPESVNQPIIGIYYALFIALQYYLQVTLFTYFFYIEDENEFG